MLFQSSGNFLFASAPLLLVGRFLIANAVWYFGSCWRATSLRHRCIPIRPTRQFSFFQPMRYRRSLQLRLRLRLRLLGPRFSGYVLLLGGLFQTTGRLRSRLARSCTWYPRADLQVMPSQIRTRTFARRILFRFSLVSILLTSNEARNVVDRNAHLRRGNRHFRLGWAEDDS